MNLETAIEHEFTVPWPVLDSWLAYATEKGIRRADIGQHAGLAKARNASISAGASLIQFERLVRAVHELTGDDGVGFEVGWRMPPTTYGSLGQALVASATLQDAIEVCQRFWSLLASGIVLDFSVHDGHGVFSFFLKFPLPSDLRRIALESFMTSIYRGLTLLTPGAAEKVELWFDYPEPAYSVRIRESVPNVRFGMPLLQCRFAAELLDAPLAFASAAGRLAAIQQCELEERTLTPRGTYTARVQRELGYRAKGYPTLVQVAGLMGMSVRTLRRKLIEEGSSYSTLLDAARLRDAVLLLENRALPIAQVAEYLGYNDVANFTRAFRKRTGMAPSQFRVHTAQT